MDNTTQTMPKITSVHQNALSFTQVTSFSLTLHSNFHCYSPSSAKSTHHLNPTNSLPDKFLTIQKSIADAMTTATSTLKGLVRKGKIR